MKMNEDDRYSKVRERARCECKDDIDAIWVFGSEPQSKLADFSKAIAGTLAVGTGKETERIIGETIDRLEKSVLQERRFAFWRLRESSKVRYRETLRCVDDMTINLRIRQAQLLKDVKIFDELEKLITECKGDLEIYLEEGENYLAERQKREDNSDFRVRFESFLYTIDS